MIKEIYNNDACISYRHHYVFYYEKYTRITLEEIIKRHKENNLQLIYYLDKKYNSYMEEDDIYFNKKEDILKYIQLKLDNIIEK